MNLTHRITAIATGFVLQLQRERRHLQTEREKEYFAHVQVALTAILDECAKESAAAPQPEQPARDGVDRIDRGEAPMPGQPYSWDAVDEALLHWYGHKLNFTQSERRRFFDAIQVYMRTQPPQQADGGAVAWEHRYQAPNGEWSRWAPCLEQCFNERWPMEKAIDNEYRALYTAPPKSPQPEVDDAMVSNLYDELFLLGRYKDSPVPIDPKAIIRNHLQSALGGGA